MPFFYVLAEPMWDATPFAQPTFVNPPSGLEPHDIAVTFFYGPHDTDKITISGPHGSKNDAISKTSVVSSTPLKFYLLQTEANIRMIKNKAEKLVMAQCVSKATTSATQSKTTVGGAVEASFSRQTVYAFRPNMTGARVEVQGEVNDAFEVQGEANVGVVLSVSSSTLNFPFTLTVPGGTFTLIRNNTPESWNSGPVNPNHHYNYSLLGPGVDFSNIQVPYNTTSFGSMQLGGVTSLKGINCAESNLLNPITSIGSGHTQLTDLTYGNFSDMTINLIDNCDFSGANFSGSTVQPSGSLSNSLSSFNGANFTGATISINLASTNLSGANLRDANMSESISQGLQTQTTILASNITGTPASLPSNINLVPDPDNPTKFRLVVSGSGGYIPTGSGYIPISMPNIPTPVPI